MRKSLTFPATGLLTLGLHAQSFECHATGALPSGVTFYAVGLGIPLGGSLPTLVTNSVGYTIP